MEILQPESGMVDLIHPQTGDVIPTVKQSADHLIGCGWKVKAVPPEPEKEELKASINSKTVKNYVTQDK